MKKNKRVLITLIFLVAAVAIFAGAAAYSYSRERAECFQRLVGYTEQIGEQIQTEMNEDKEYLVRFAEQLSKNNLSDTNTITADLMLSSNMGMFSELALLFPEDKMLFSDGTTKDAAEVLSFDELKNQTEYISKRTSDMEDPEKQIIYHCVPVSQNGQVTAILCGVIDLADMPDLFRIYDYGDNYNVFVFEASTGMYIQDSWHDELSSVDKIGKRETKPGYSMEEFDKAVRNQESASVVFMSKSAGEYFYSYAAPAQVSDWMVMVTVLEPVVFAQATELLTIFAFAAIMLLLVFAIYFMWILKDVHKDNREKEKQIRNVSYMLSVENMLFDAHVFPEHFTLALKHIAEYLSAGSAFLWLTEDGWAVDRRYWNYGVELCMDGQVTKNFKTLFPHVYEELEKTKGIIINSKTELLSKFPEEGKKLADKQVNNLMIIPVYDVEGNIVFVLGACNVKNQWNNLDPLHQVAVSFSMTINHYEAYHALQMMGTTDAMTGVLNRNSYHEAIDGMETEKPEALGCVYIDINGLHEINNYLGHQAGDQLLRTVADALKKWFVDVPIYRIGGDEFVVFCENWTEQHMIEMLNSTREELGRMNYEFSVGTVWEDGDYKIGKIIETAEKRMRQDKEYFYSNGGKERSLRRLNEQMERVVAEKQDTEAFLTALEDEFLGVYFVDLDTHEMRHLFIPDYFAKIMKEVDGDFVKGILEYTHCYVADEDQEKMQQVADFDWLKEQMSHDVCVVITYQKTDGTKLQLRIEKYNVDGERQCKTQWIFKNVSKKDEL